MCQSRSKMLFCQLSAWRKPPFILLPFNLSHTSHLCSSNFSAKQNKPNSFWVNNNKWRGRSKRVEGEVGRTFKNTNVTNLPSPWARALQTWQKREDCIFYYRYEPEFIMWPNWITTSAFLQPVNPFHWGIFISVQHLIYYDLLEGLS